MNCLARILIFAAILPLLASCADTAKIPPHSPEMAEREEAALRVSSVEIFKQRLERLIRVHYEISVANVELCGSNVHGSLGAEFDIISRHPKEFRDAQTRVFGITDAVTVRIVVPGSVADYAGLLPGDQIIAVDEHNAEDESWIDNTLLPIIHKGNFLTLTVKRPAGTIMIEVRPAMVCSYPVELDFDDDITAKTNGVTIAVTTGALRFIASDDEVAFAITHEMAHNLLDLHGGYQSDEFAADQLAGYLMARAGFSVQHAVHFFRRLAVEDPDSIRLNRSGNHPSTALRVILLEKLHREIQAKKALGEPLAPTPIP